MRAVVIDEYGGPEVLHVAELPEPEPGPGEVAVRVAAAAVNPVDLATRAGLLGGGTPASPVVLGWDLSGTVEAVGTGVTRWQVGDRVVAFTAQPATGRGTYAELVVLDEALFAPAPSAVPLVDGAALPLAAVTAAQALAALELESGASLLVVGASGAVGGFAVQLAAASGLTVSAYAAGADAETVAELGASEVLPREQPLPPASFDAVLDTAGAKDTIVAVRDGGSYVSVVAAPDAERGIEPRMNFVNQDGPRLAELVQLVNNGTLTLRIGGKYGLDGAVEAHERLAAGGTRGKLLLVP